MIKYLFSDLDGTLFVNEDVHINDKNSIWEFTNSGGIFSIASGRSDFEINNFVMEENLPNSFFKVSSNGAMVTDEHNNVLSCTYIAQDVCEGLYHFLKENFDRISVAEIGTENMLYYLNNPLNFTLDYKDNRYVIDKDSLEYLLDTNTKIFKLYIEGTKDFINDLTNYFSKYFLGKVEIFNDITAVNIAPRGINKGVGIKKILKKYNISPNEIAVIGDAANDLDMFDITKNSFTFVYSYDFVQERAAYTVDNFSDALKIIKRINNKVQY